MKQLKNNMPSHPESSLPRINCHNAKMPFFKSAQKDTISKTAPGIWKNNLLLTKIDTKLTVLVNSKTSNKRLCTSCAETSQIFFCLNMQSQIIKSVSLLYPLPYKVGN